MPPPELSPAAAILPLHLPAWAIRSLPERSGADHAVPAGPAHIGAALAVLDAAVASAAPHAGAWVNRLAFMAAAVAVARSGRPEDEAALRDLVAVSPAQPAGPAAPVLGAYLWLAAGPPGPRWGELPNLIAGLGARTDGLPDVLTQALATAADLSCPLAAAATALQAVLAVRPDRRALAAWAADVVLARWLGWPSGLPLVTLGLPQGHVGLAELAAAQDGAGLAGAVLRGSARALDRFALLGHRAAVLQAVRPRLRARAAGQVVDRLLARDALSVAGVRDLIAERAARRLFDRLVALGVVRELTGRTTARLYGL
ncbi:hypothetical protein A6A40_23360 (plasmid) [Azospirillum humicireducens]|uniref:DUF1403 domain-containing protein n=1 Tax=Azospirillum humicireducens TaxID=1226968 RepID=A0A2R4VU79_9PROT|nr:DUF1403 family protein [Azospirillum humicireducens]AWB07993.1 hypothetical protein A6A40_23360 [Azospirillum humicireducens]